MGVYPLIAFDSTFQSRELINVPFWTLHIKTNARFQQGAWDYAIEKQIYETAIF